MMMVREKLCFHKFIYYTLYKQNVLFDKKKRKRAKRWWMFLVKCFFFAMLWVANVGDFFAKGTPEVTCTKLISWQSSKWLNLLFIYRMCTSFFLVKDIPFQLLHRGDQHWLLLLKTTIVTLFEEIFGSNLSFLLFSVIKSWALPQNLSASLPPCIITRTIHKTQQNRTTESIPFNYCMLLSIMGENNTKNLLKTNWNPDKKSR